MMSITNLMRGFDSHNRGQLYFETGPTFSINSGQYTESLKTMTEEEYRKELDELVTYL